MGGNWKCNPTSLTAIDKLVTMINSLDIDLQRVQVVLGPPAPFLIHVRNLLDQRFNVACQNCYCEDSGAFTGEISPPMLNSIGVSHVILGHSERRSLFMETNEVGMGRDWCLSIKPTFS